MTEWQGERQQAAGGLLGTTLEISMSQAACYYVPAMYSYRRRDMKQIKELMNHTCELASQERALD